MLWFLYLFIWSTLGEDNFPSPYGLQNPLDSKDSTDGLQNPASRLHDSEFQLDSFERLQATVKTLRKRKKKGEGPRVGSQRRTKSEEAGKAQECKAPPTPRSYRQHHVTACPMAEACCPTRLCASPCPASCSPGCSCDNRKDPHPGINITNIRITKLSNNPRLNSERTDNLIDIADAIQDKGVQEILGEDTVREVQKQMEDLVQLYKSYSEVEPLFKPVPFDPIPDPDFDVFLVDSFLPVDDPEDSKEDAPNDPGPLTGEPPGPPSGEEDAPNDPDPPTGEPAGPVISEPPGGRPGSASNHPSSAVGVPKWNPHGRRSRQADQPSEQPPEQMITKIALEETDDTLDSLQENIKLLEGEAKLLEGEESESCFFTKREAMKTIKMNIESLNRQIQAANSGNTANVEAFLKTIEDIRVEQGERIKHCDFIWGRRYLDEVGDYNYIDRVEKPLPRDCKDECKKVECNCWTWTEDKDGKTFCDLKDEANCKALSRDWKSSTVSAVFHSCVDKTKDSDGNWQPDIKNEITGEQLQPLDDFRENEADQEKEEAFSKMYNEATDLQKATIMHVRKEDLKEKILRLNATQHAPVYTPSPAASDVNVKTNDFASKVRKQDKEFRRLLEETKTKGERKADAYEAILAVKKIFAPSERSNTKASVNYQWMKTISFEKEKKKRKELIESYKAWSIGKNGQLKDEDETVKNKIQEFISVAERMDKLPMLKAKAAKMLGKNTMNLTPSQKVFLENVVNNLPPETSETADEAKERKERYAEAIKKAKEERIKIAQDKKTKGSRIIKSVPKKLANVKKGVVRGLRNARELSTTGKINGLNNAINTVNAGIKKFESGDGVQVASGILDIGATIASLAGPAGAPFAAVFGVVNTILGLFGKAPPSQIEVMTEMINDQTEILVSKIDESQKELLEYLEKEFKAQTNTLVKAIQQDSWRTMIDEMSGSTNSLNLKKKHFLAYSDTCISNWNEVALLASIEAVTTSLGKVASFMGYFCISRESIAFCGSMLFQYVNLANLRSSVQGEAIRIVRASKFHNQESKLAGLLEEYRGAQKIDAKFLAKTFKETDNEYLCFAACTLHGIPEQGAVQNVIAKADIGFEKKQMDYVYQFFKQVGLTLSRTKKVNENCRKCYLDTDCDDGYEKGPDSGQCWKKTVVKVTKKENKQDTDGGIYDLAKLSFQCADGMALSQFKMEKDGDKTRGKIWYDYTCRSSSDYGPLTTVEKTKPSYQRRYDNWHVKHIDQHNEFTKDPCGGNDRVLAGFTLKVPIKTYDFERGSFLKQTYQGETKYQVWCRKTPYKMNCKKTWTDKANTGTEYVQALARHNLDCGTGFIKGFSFDYYKSGSTSFDYWCCRPDWEKFAKGKGNIKEEGEEEEEDNKKDLKKDIKRIVSQFTKSIKNG